MGLGWILSSEVSFSKAFAMRMSASGTSRNSAASQNLVAIEGQPTWPDLLWFDHGVNDPLRKCNIGVGSLSFAAIS
jgi:hypothetical protein